MIFQNLRLIILLQRKYLHMTLILLRLMFGANILVCAWISITCLFYPRKAMASIFENSLAYSESVRLVGALWGGILVLSILGLFRPVAMSPILLFQLVYKGSWLLFVAFPALRAAQPYPTGMATFFLIWVLILPWIIPWANLFGLSPD